jgi:hypothetical protein
LEPGKTKAQRGNRNNKKGPKQHKCQKKGQIASKYGKPSSPYNSLHWTACYDDSCLVHKDGKDNGYYLRTPKKELGRRTGPSAPTNRQIVELEEAKEDKFDDDLWIIRTDQGNLKDDRWVKVPEPPKSSPNGKARIAMVRQAKSWTTYSNPEEDTMQLPNEIPDQ